MPRSGAETALPPSPAGSERLVGPRLALSLVATLPTSEAISIVALGPDASGELVEPTIKVGHHPALHPLPPKTALSLFEIVEFPA